MVFHYPYISLFFYFFIIYYFFACSRNIFGMVDLVFIGFISVFLDLSAKVTKGH